MPYLKYLSDVTTNDVKPLNVEVSVNDTVYCGTVTVKAANNIAYFPVVRIENWSTDRPSVVRNKKYPEISIEISLILFYAAAYRLRIGSIDHFNRLLCVLLRLLSRQGSHHSPLQIAATIELCRYFALRRSLFRYITLFSY